MRPVLFSHPLAVQHGKRILRIRPFWCKNGAGRSGDITGDKLGGLGQLEALPKSCTRTLAGIMKFAEHRALAGPHSLNAHFIVGTNGDSYSFKLDALPEVVRGLLGSRTQAALEALGGRAAFEISLVLTRRFVVGSRPEACWLCRLDCVLSLVRRCCS